LTEEEKEDLFLYSQGESGATFNRAENESSFLTGEKKKFTSGLKGVGNIVDQSESQLVSKPSPSFDALKELSLSQSKSID
jgi:hypothetical protein